MNNLENNEKQTLQEEPSSAKRLLFVVFLVIVVCLTVVAGILKPNTPTPVIVVQSAPEGIMGTDCRLGVVVKATASKTVIQRCFQEVLHLLEDQLRSWETATFSNWIDDSEISRRNRGEIDQPSEELSFVLNAAQKANRETHGAFDVYCRPVIDLWKNAAKTGVLPTEEQILQAKNQRDKIDLGGIAKGRCIDLALDFLIQGGSIAGAMVDIGGDVAVYGASGKGGFWTFSIVNPYSSSEIWGRFRIQTVIDNKPIVKAVCTSGSYFRGFDIDGVHYSHIIDPRLGKPISPNMAPASVTVIANDCMTADIWATALCVLGEQGLQYIPSDVAAYLIFGQAHQNRVVKTKNFPEVTLLTKSNQSK